MSKFIDIFNFKKYNKRKGDNNIAKIGHVNYAITQATTGCVVNTTIENNELIINTVGSKTIIVVSEPITNDIDVILGNPGMQCVGDQLIILTKPDSTSTNIDFNFSSDFYITFCSGPDPVLSFTEGMQERDMTMFIFDGEVFLATWDNC